MNITPADRVRMERAHVHAWPALRTANIEGWLWRSSGGGSQRANSVSTIDFKGNDPGAAIDQAEALYQTTGTPPRFQTFNETNPPNLTKLLYARGYRQTESTVTMFKPAAAKPMPSSIEIRDTPEPDWLDTYLNEVTESRRIINAEILRHIPAQKAFFSFRQNTKVISTALCVIDHGCAVMECVTTRADARRKGAARTILTALEYWVKVQNADLIGLQVVIGNKPAISLYQQLGFEAGAKNSFWVKE